MISATALKNATKFVQDGKPYVVVKYEHKKIARGGGTVKLTVRNLESGNQELKTLNSTVKVDEIHTFKKRLQYLYSDGQIAVFMDPVSFEQSEIPVKVLGDKIKYVKEGEEVDVVFWDQRPLSVEVAPKVTLEVAQTDPGVKGNSATNIYKPARLENGLNVKVPLFIKNGDKVRVDTRTGEYTERA